MNCVDARQLFSPWLDGELDEASAVALRLHLEGCGECRAELSRWEDVSRALQQSRPEAAAPSGFSAAVMARIREEAPAAKSRRTAAKRGVWNRWREFLAVAAAAALLFFGWWAVKPDVPNGPGEVARKTEKPSAVVKTADTGAEVSQPAGGDGNLSQPAVEPGGGAVQTEDGAGWGPAETGVATPAQNGSGIKPPAGSTGERVFLNKERKITSTLIRVSVGDLAAARAQAESTAARFGVKPELVAQQAAGSDKLVVYRMLVEPGRAEALEDAVMGLGKVVDYQEETRDVTQEFARTLEQYRGLVAQLAATGDSAQKKELEAKVKDLEEQLVSWDNASSHRVIVLWLQ